MKNLTKPIGGNQSLMKILIRMKLTFLFILTGLISVSASTYSQNTKLDITVEDNSLISLFREIEENSEFFFFYQKEELENLESVTINKKSSKVTDILDEALSDTELEYKIVDRYIIVRKDGKGLEDVESITSQQSAISGTVTDEAGGPLPGVTVVIKGTTNGTVTDIDGKYSISNISNGATLQFSFLGMATQEVEVGSQTTINIKMMIDAIGLEEVVAVGYGTIKRTEVTGAITSLKTESLETMSASTIDARLQGQVAGLSISGTTGEPGSGYNIRIRGNNSISASNRPLIVLDGFPMDDQVEATAWGRGGSNNDLALNPLSSINPDDIESIEVLKDASATAIYGARGANGVIVITTKSGEIGKTEITFTTEQSVSPIPTYSGMMTGPQYRENLNWYKENVTGEEPQYTDSAIVASPNSVWMDEISQVARSQKYNLSIRGGNEGIKYFVSVDYLDQNGVILNSNYTRGNVRANLDMKLTERLNANISFNYNRSLANRRAQTSFSLDVGGPVFRSLRARPDLLVDNEEGFLTELDENGNFYANPLSEARDLYDYTNNENTLINMKLQYRIVDGLDLILSAGNNNLSSLREQFYPFNTAGGNKANGRGVYNTAHVNDYRIEPYLTYRKGFKGHNVNLTLGTSYKNNINKSTLYSAANFPTDALGVDAMHLGTDVFYRSNAKIGRTMKSAYYRANYNYQGRYLVSFTGRYDGSSVLAEDEKWAFFPAFSAGWTISKEKFMKSIDMLSNLKIRGSYGQTGSQSIAPYSTLTLLGKQNPVLNGAEHAGQGLNQNLGNIGLTWEVTTQSDIGLDLGLFKNRISVVADYYEKSTDGLLQNKQLPPSSGFVQTRANYGTMENKGFEFSVQADIVQQKDFKWSTGVTFSNNKTTVKDLGSPDVIIEGPNLVNNLMSYSSNIMQQGQPFGAFKGYKVEGLIQPSDFDENGDPTFAMMNNDQTLGAWKFADVDTSGVINESDRVIIGDPNPDFTLGWSNTISYKRISLSAMAYASFGAEVLNATNAFIRSGAVNYNRTEEWWNNRWTTENQHNDPRYPSYAEGNNIEVNDQMVEDGTFIRLKSLTLSYSLPELSQIKTAQVYFTATNLFTITNYSGFDPEVNARGTNNIVQGVDLGGYPTPKTFTIGVKVGF
jgi:TonB-linked SusC/RagA family outer membrane protein